MVTPYLQQQREAVRTPQPLPATTTTTVIPRRRSSHHHSTDAGAVMSTAEKQGGGGSALAEHNSTVIIEATPPRRGGSSMGFVRSNFPPNSSAEASDGKGAAPPPSRLLSIPRLCTAPVPTTNVSAPNSQRDSHSNSSPNVLSEHLDGLTEGNQADHAYLVDHHVSNLVSQLYQSVVSVMPEEPIRYIIDQLRLEDIHPHSNPTSSPAPELSHPTPSQARASSATPQKPLSPAPSDRFVTSTSPSHSKMPPPMLQLPPSPKRVSGPEKPVIRPRGVILDSRSSSTVKEKHHDSGTVPQQSSHRVICIPPSPPKSPFAVALAHPSPKPSVPPALPSPKSRATPPNTHSLSPVSVSVSSVSSSSPPLEQRHCGDGEEKEWANSAFTSLARRSSSSSSGVHQDHPPSSDEATAVPSKTLLSSVSTMTPSLEDSEVITVVNVATLQAEVVDVETASGPTLTQATTTMNNNSTLQNINSKPPRQPTLQHVPSGNSLRGVDSLESPSTSLSKGFDDPMSPTMKHVSSQQPMLLSNIIGGEESPPPGLGQSFNGMSVGSLGLRTSSASKIAQVVLPQQRINSIMKSPSFNGSWVVDNRSELRSSSDISVFSCGSMDVQDFLTDFKLAKNQCLGEKPQLITLDDLSDILDHVNVPLPDANLLSDLFTELQVPAWGVPMMIEGTGSRLGKPLPPPSPPAPPPNGFNTLTISGNSGEKSNAKNTAKDTIRRSCADECSASTVPPNSSPSRRAPCSTSSSHFVENHVVGGAKPTSAPGSQKGGKGRVASGSGRAPSSSAEVPTTGRGIMVEKEVVSRGSRHGTPGSGEGRPSAMDSRLAVNLTPSAEGREDEERVEFDTFLCRMAFMIQGRYPQEVLRSVFHAMVEDYDRGLSRVSYQGHGWLDSTLFSAPVYGGGSAGLSMLLPDVDVPKSNGPAINNSGLELGDFPRGSTPTMASPRSLHLSSKALVSGANTTAERDSLPPLSQTGVGVFAGANFMDFTCTVPLYYCVMDGIYRRLGLRQVTGAHIQQALRCVRLPDDDLTFECHVNDFTTLVSALVQVLNVTTPPIVTACPTSASSLSSSKSGCRPSPQSVGSTILPK